MMKTEVSCTIIMYHYVRIVEETPYPEIKALSTKKFKKQLDHLIKNYTIIRFDDYCNSLAGGNTVPQNSCILTFDDGLKDHFTNVFPLLLEKKIPASFFPITQPLIDHTVPSVHKTHFLLAKIGSELFANQFNQIITDNHSDSLSDFIIHDKFKLDPKYRFDDNLTANIKVVIAKMPQNVKEEILNDLFSRFFNDEKWFCDELYLNWDEMREMMENNMIIGGHTHSHPLLSELSYEEQRIEIERSTKALETNLNTKINVFSYPYGGYNDRTIEILQHNQFIGSVTTKVGTNNGSVINPFQLCRYDTNDIPS